MKESDWLYAFTQYLNKMVQYPRWRGKFFDVRKFSAGGGLVFKYLKDWIEKNNPVMLIHPPLQFRYNQSASPPAGDNEQFAVRPGVSSILKIRLGQPPR